MTMLEKLRYHLKGWKTLWINIVLGLPVVLDILQQIVAGLLGIDLTPILPPGWGKWFAAALAVANVVLRVLATTGPIGTKQGLVKPDA